MPNFSQRPTRPNLFTTVNSNKPTYEEIISSRGNMSLPAKEETQSRMPLLVTPTYGKGGETIVGRSPFEQKYKEIDEWTPFKNKDTEKKVALPVAQNEQLPQQGQPKTFSPFAGGGKPASANTAITQGTTEQPKKELSWFDKFTTPDKEGEYSTAREIGTGIANFAEHFGNSLSGAGNAGTVDRWNQIRQQYREKNPNSDISKLYQNTFGKLGIDSTGKSAWDLKQMQPSLGLLTDKSQFDAKMRMSGIGGGTGQAKIKEPNDAERKNLGYYERMKNADALLDKGGFVGNEFFQAPEFLGNRVKSSERQLAENAKRDWMIANLRKESGAAIGAEEYKSQDQTYFPQPGDSPEVIENKRKQREQVRRNTFLESGNAGRQKHMEGEKK